ncbi:MAG TPA: alcohol dehydrogenase catalytic domain-containing protein [Candidatus Brocadiia bacterium]|nr:alcohol dehydrogenase catalytic domain-containing protein [Candidatus Brocadiia bacterium]
MKALITDGQGRVEVRETPMPELGDYDSLVRIEGCLFCNSTDRHLVGGTFPWGAQYPAILGHETAGIVEKTGPKVRRFHAGDRVLRAYAVWPGEKLGPFASAWGGFAQYGKVRDGQAMLEDGVVKPEAVPGYCRYQQIAPPGISLDQALMMIPAKELWSAVAKIADVTDQRFLVVGAGVAGVLAGRFLKLRGAARVAITARRKGPLTFALSQNAADEVFLSEDIERRTESYDALVEVSGSMDAAMSALRLVPPGGRVYSYAVYDRGADPAIFDPIKARHVFARIDPAEHTAHDDVTRLMREGKLLLDPFVTKRFPLDRAAEAWQTVLDKTTLKTAIIF